MKFILIPVFLAASFASVSTAQERVRPPAATAPGRVPDLENHLLAVKEYFAQVMVGVDFNVLLAEFENQKPRRRTVGWGSAKPIAFTNGTKGIVVCPGVPAPAFLITSNLKMYRSAKAAHLLGLGDGRGAEPPKREWNDASWVALPSLRNLTKLTELELTRSGFYEAESPQLNPEPVKPARKNPASTGPEQLNPVPVGPGR